MGTVDFTMKALLQEACDRAGLSDFGDDSFRDGLQSLLDTYSSNHFTDSAQKQLRRRMRDLLVSRLTVEDAFKRHPEVKGLALAQPVFLTGLPRTGTSALLNVLSSDPATRVLKLWEAHNPAPLEGFPEPEQDPRYIQTKNYYERMNATSDFKKIHYMTADSAEECIYLTNHSFQDAAYGFEIFLEPYASFYRATDRRPQYQYHADLLRLIQWQRPANRWLLKAPSHLYHIDVIMEQHPDACIIITHRSPLEVVGSYCSMMMNVMPEQTQIDPRQLGRRVLEDLTLQVNRSMAVRNQRGSDRIVDVHYVDFIDNTAAVVDELYDKLGIPYPEQTRSEIKAYIDAHPRGKHGKHEYHLAEFGLTENQVRDSFQDYIQTYDIKV